MSTPIKDESWPGPGEIVVPDEFPGPGDVKGRRVVITGASRGLGRVLAHAFCQSGATLALVSRTEADLQRLEDELDGDVVTYAVDVTNEEQSDELAQTLADRWGGIDVWIANAGISPSYGPAPEVKLDDWRQVIDVGKWDASGGIHLPGQSGQPGSRHYRDLSRRWKTNRQFPLYWSAQEVRRHARTRLVLAPLPTTHGKEAGGRT